MHAYRIHKTEMKEYLERFLIKIMEDIRVSIKEDKFLELKEEFYKNYKSK